MLSSQTQTANVERSFFYFFFIWFLCSNYVLFTCFRSVAFLIICRRNCRLLFSFTHTNACSHILLRLTFITSKLLWLFVCGVLCTTEPSREEELASGLLYVVEVLLSQLWRFHSATISFVIYFCLCWTHRERSTASRTQAPGYGSKHTKLENIKCSSGRCMSITFCA